MPDLSSVHIDRALTEVSVAYTNPAYVGEQVMPVVPVPIRSNKYFIYGKEAFMSSSGVDAQGRPSSIRRPKTRSEEIDFSLSTGAYFAEQFARNHPIADEERQYSDMPLQPEVDATLLTTETVKIDYELFVARKAMNRSNYATGNKAQLVTSTTTWLPTGSNSHPLSADIPNAKKAIVASMIRAATNILFNYNVAMYLVQHPEYKDWVKYTSREGLTSAGIAPVISGLSVIEPMCQYVTSAEGAAVTNGMIWVDDQGQDSALVFYRAPSIPSLKTATYGMTFEAPDATLGARGFVVKRWREEWRDVEVVETRTTRDVRFTATDGSTNGDNSQGYATGGYLISGCLL